MRQSRPRKPVGPPNIEVRNGGGEREKLPEPDATIREAANQARGAALVAIVALCTSIGACGMAIAGLVR